LVLQASKVFRLEGDSDRVVVTFRQLRVRSEHYQSPWSGFVSEMTQTDSSPTQELVGSKGHVALGVMISKPDGEVEVLLNPQVRVQHHEHVGKVSSPRRMESIVKLGGGGEGDRGWNSKSAS